MKDIECPYCGHDQEVCHDDGQGYDEDQKHEMGCYECGKSFVFYTSISFSYEPRKADCLNDGKHTFKPTHTHPIELTKMMCTQCDYRRKPNKLEMESILKSRKKIVI